MDAIGNAPRESSSGTLLWVGDATLSEFHDAYRFSVQHASQLALRVDVAEALARPAADVRCIVIARSNRWPLVRNAFNALAQRYPQAIWIDLLGPLCEGVREVSNARAQRVPWHRWESAMRGLFGSAECEGVSSIHIRSQTRPIQGSVAVLATCYATAESYLDLAESVGATSFWCHTADGLRSRHVSTAWWDDTLASPTTPDLWRERLAAFERGGRRVHHVWVTHSGRLDHLQAAVRGGVARVLTKPFLTGLLLSSLEQVDQKTGEGSRRHAA